MRGTAHVHHLAIVLVPFALAEDTALLKHAARLWGSEQAAMDAIKVHQLVHGGQMMKLAALKQDDTIPRLAAEMDKDRYHLADVRKLGHGLILDVGANIGDVSVAAALKFPDAQIIAVEAVPHIAWIIRYNLLLNNISHLSLHDIQTSNKPGVHVWNRAVVSDSQLTAVNISFSPTMSQNAAVSYSGFNAWNSFPVKTIQSSDLLSFPKPIKLLKVDCEGCEFDLVPGLGNAFFNRAKVERFTAELHLSLVPVSSGPQPQTMARVRTSAETKLLFDALTKRGCSTAAWDIYC